jgi:aryl-alcohol dehydrogenase-like predicted oxidoreductase
MTVPPAFAHAPSTIPLGDLEVVRLGFGAMRLPGPEVWGEPEDPARAREVLRRVVALGMNLIDSAWYYGPHVSNRLIAETLHPYPKDLVIASKLGGRRLPDKGWAPFVRPEQLRRGARPICATFVVRRSTSFIYAAWASLHRCPSPSRSTP